MTYEQLLKYLENTPPEEVDWRLIDKFADNHNRYHDLENKVRELKEYYKNLRYESR